MAEEKVRKYFERGVNWVGIAENEPWDEDHRQSLEQDGLVVAVDLSRSTYEKWRELRRKANAARKAEQDFIDAAIGKELNDPDWYYNLDGWEQSDG